MQEAGAQIEFSHFSELKRKRARFQEAEAFRICGGKGVGNYPRESYLEEEFQQPACILAEYQCTHAEGETCTAKQE